MSFRVQSLRLAVFQRHVSLSITNCSVLFSCKCHDAAVWKQVDKDILTFLESHVVQKYLTFAMSGPNGQGSTTYAPVQQSGQISICWTLK